jgi:Holliday junction resolvase
MGNPFLDRAEKTKNLSNSHRRSKKQEKEIATKIGGKITPASGSREVKGDVRLKGIVRVECKTTKNKSFSVTLEMVEKIEDAAVEAGEMPVLIVEFTDGFGRKIKEVAVCPTYVLDSIREG